MPIVGPLSDGPMVLRIGAAYEALLAGRNARSRQPTRAGTACTGAGTVTGQSSKGWRACQSVTL